MMKLLKIKLNVPLNGFLAGREIEIKVDKNKIPLDRFWRARLEDSKSDNCIEIVKETKKAAKPKTPKESK